MSLTDYQPASLVIFLFLTYMYYYPKEGNRYVRIYVTCFREVKLHPLLIRLMKIQLQYGY